MKGTPLADALFDIATSWLAHKYSVVPPKVIPPITLPVADRILQNTRCLAPMSIKSVPAIAIKQALSPIDLVSAPVLVVTCKVKSPEFLVNKTISSGPIQSVLSGSNLPPFIANLESAAIPFESSALILSN